MAEGRGKWGTFRLVNISTSGAKLLTNVEGTNTSLAWSYISICMSTSSMEAEKKCQVVRRCQLLLTSVEVDGS